MKKYLQTSLKWFLTIAVFQIVSVTDAAVRTDAQGGGFLGKTLIADSGQFDGNRIRNDLENNGMLVSHRITGHSGMEWPKGPGPPWAGPGTPKIDDFCPVNTLNTS